MKPMVALLLLFFSALAAAAQVNGHVQIIDGKPVLTVWGTHTERGYAAGYLAGADGKEVFDEYIVGYCCGWSPATYAFLRSYYAGHYSVDPKYADEAQGIIQGMVAGGTSLWNSTLGRNIDATDILIANAIVDLSSALMRGGPADAWTPVVFGCSSLSSWGASTQADPYVDGHLVITRLLDWSKHPTLTDNPLLTVHFPSEADEQPWLSVGYAGLFGALSAISESGVSATLNMGNNNGVSTPAPHHPILLTVRNGMEAADYDGDGSHSPADIAAAIADRPRSLGTIVHATQDLGGVSRPIVIESNNAAGVAVRDQSHNVTEPGDNLILTNHFRLLYPPVYCYRYAGIVDSLEVSTDMTCERSWSVMAGAAGVWSSNIQCMQYVESRGLLRWAMDTYTEPAYVQTPTELSVWDLFGCQAGVEGGGVEGGVAGCVLRQNSPNPFNPTTTIAFGLSSPSDCTLSVYDVAGRRVATLLDEFRGPGTHRVEWDGRNDTGAVVPTGVYLYRLETNSGAVERKMLLLK